MRLHAILLPLVLLFSLNAFADKPPGHQDDRGTPPGQAKKSGLAPGLAKKNGLPPGLAKKLGATQQSMTYLAVDPQHDDRVWVLSGGQWRLRQGFDDSLRGEVRQLQAAPPTARIAPPVPLPFAISHLRVMVFTG